MKTEIANVSALMKEYGYGEFQQKLYNSIAQYVACNMPMENTGDIEVNTSAYMQEISVTFVGAKESYYVMMRDEAIWVDYCIRRTEMEDNGKRTPVYDGYVWRLSIFATEARLRESYFNVYEGHDYNRRLEEARLFLQNVLSNIDVTDDCAWLTV